MISSKPFLSPPLAGLFRRLLALLYEILLSIAVIMVLSGLFKLIFPPIKDNFHYIAFLAYEIASVFLYLGVCWVKGGQTLAMKAWRIQLRREKGGAISWLQALVRYLIICTALIPIIPIAICVKYQVLSSYWAWIALFWGTFPYLWAGVDKERQFLHDRMIKAKLISTQPY